jgi:hypothetical protein
MQLGGTEKSPSYNYGQQLISLVGDVCSKKNNANKAQEHSTKILSAMPIERIKAKSEGERFSHWQIACLSRDNAIGDHK